MNDQRFPNIVWLLVDSIRTYHTDLDNRGKLPFMEEFGRESVEFAHCVTTAPSTIMSVSAMMTGLPAYFLARNYDDFRFDNRHYFALANILKNNGYSSYAFLRGQETRLKFKNMLDPVDRELWPSHLRHGRKWNNEDLNLLLDRVIDAGVSRPSFLFFHFNPDTRDETKQQILDLEVSERVKHAQGRLVEAGFTPDNTITILCSDHGFPDPSTGMSTDWEVKNRMTHDLVLTDDNILIPMYIQYPGCTPRTVDHPVSSLDVFPTLLDLAGIPQAQEVKRAIDGESLWPVLEGGASGPARKYFRCDSRLMLQSGRATALRGADYKYIRFHDQHRLEAAGEATADGEVLLDLRADPEETANLLLADPITPATEAVLSEVREAFARSEARAVEYQVGYLLARQAESLRSTLSAGSGRANLLLAFESDTAGFSDIGVRAVARTMEESNIDVLTSDPAAVSGLEQVVRVSGYSARPSGELELSGGGASREYDVILVFVQSPGSASAARLITLTKPFRCRQHILIDCNFNVYRHNRYWFYRALALIERMSLVAKEPSLLWANVKTVEKVMRRHLLRKLGRWDRWRSVS